MLSSRRQDTLVLCMVGFVLASHDARAQSAADSTSGRGGNADQPEHMQMNMPMNNAWQLMQDGIVFAEFNHQGGPRGGNEFVVPNWWMGMASREMRRGRLRGALVAFLARPLAFALRTADRLTPRFL